MNNKTLIITYKPSVAKELGEMLNDDIKVESGDYIEGYLEGDSYVITWALIDFEEDYVNTTFELDDQKSLRDLIIDMRETQYHVNRGMLGKYNERFFITKDLICRKDIDNIIWYACEDAPYLAMFDFCYRWIGCPLKKNRLCFEKRGELGYYIPMTELKSERVMKRYYDAMRYSSLRESMFSAYFNKAIELIFNKRYMAHEQGSFDDFNEYDALVIKTIYDKTSRFYSSGTILLEMEKLRNPRFPIFYSYFPVSGSYKDTVRTLEVLLEKGIIRINKRTQKISPTKYGQQIFEIITDYLPNYADIRTLIYWRKQINKMIQGKITGEEYLNEAREYVKQSLTGLM